MDSAVAVRHDIKLVTPFPRSRYPDLWGWLQEFPKQNFDDGGPRTLGQFEKWMDARVSYGGHTVYEVVSARQTVGAIGMIFGSKTAKFCGICFSKAVHGTGVAREAVGAVLDKAFARGAHVVIAEYFADNIAIRKFFQKMGARDVGEFMGFSMRGGEPVKCKRVAFYRSDECHSLAS